MTTHDLIQASGLLTLTQSVLFGETRPRERSAPNKAGHMVPEAMASIVADGRWFAARCILNTIERGAIDDPTCAAATVRTWRDLAQRGQARAAWAKDYGSCAFDKGAAEVYAQAADMLGAALDSATRKPEGVAAR